MAKYDYNVRENERIINQTIVHHEECRESPGYGFVLACGAVIVGLIGIALLIPVLAGFLRDIL